MIKLLVVAALVYTFGIPEKRRVMKFQEIKDFGTEVFFTFTEDK